MRPSLDVQKRAGLSQGEIDLIRLIREYFKYTPALVWRGGASEAEIRQWLSDLLKQIHGTDLSAHYIFRMIQKEGVKSPKPSKRNTY